MNKEIVRGKVKFTPKIKVKYCKTDELYKLSTGTLAATLALTDEVIVKFIEFSVLYYPKAYNGKLKPTHGLFKVVLTNDLRDMGRILRLPMRYKVITL